MPIILHHNDHLQAIYPTGEVDELALIPDGAQWFSITPEHIPQAPIEAWDVDWQSRTISVDPAKMPPPPPDWEGLVAAVMANAEFKAAWIAASAIDPTIAWSLPTAFGMVGQEHLGNFINLFEAICALAVVSPTQRAAWADIGATFSAPAEFLDIVRGEGNA